MLPPKFRILLLLVSAFVFCGCKKDDNLKTSIQSYKGDGQIRYLEAPGVLGVSGCEIRLPYIDLSRNQTTKYNLSGIPTGKDYVVYLVLPDSNRLNELLDGEFSYQIKSNDIIQKDNKSHISKMVKTGKDGISNNMFYYWNPDKITDTSFDIDNNYDNYSITINYHGKPATNQILGYVLISRGGSK